MSGTESKPGNAHLRQAVVALPLGLLICIPFAIAAATSDSYASDAEGYTAFAAIGGLIALAGLVRLIQGLRARLQ